MRGNVLGVIGGLGPLATAIFLEEVARMTQAAADQENLDMIVYNFPSIPDRTGYILGSNLRSPLPGLLWAARALEREQVAAIAIPCVTAHYFWPELEQELSVPILSCIRETVEALSRAGVKQVGILATEGTVAADLFGEPLRRRGIRSILPSQQGQQDVDHVIYRGIKAGNPVEPEMVARVEQDLRSRGAEVLLLGCTELSVLRREALVAAPCLDVTQVLARAAIRFCGKKLKPEYDRLIG